MSSYLTDRSTRLSPPQVAVDRSTDTAHLLVPMTHDVDRFGISVCGYPAEYLAVAPDLSWSQVGSGRRCDHCDAIGCSGARS